MNHTFECPKCGERRTERLAKSISHNCKKTKSMVTFKQVPDEEIESESQ
jgi:ribosomal protein L37AE/L43A